MSLNDIQKSDIKNYEGISFRTGNKESGDGPENLMAEIEQMKSNFSKIESETNKKIKELEEENKKLKSELSVSKKIIGQFTDENQKLKNEINKMKNDNKDSLFEILEEKTFEQKTIQSAKEDRENPEKLRKNGTQNEVNSVEINSKKNHELIVNLTESIQNLENDVKMRDEFINKLKQNLENLNQEYLELGHKFEISENEKSKLLDKFNEQKEEAKRLDALVDMYQSALVKAKIAVSLLKNKISRMSSDVFSLQESREKFEKLKNTEIECLKSQITDLEKQLEGFGSSS